MRLRRNEERVSRRFSLHNHAAAVPDRRLDRYLRRLLVVALAAAVCVPGAAAAAAAPSCPPPDPQACPSGLTPLAPRTIARRAATGHAVFMRCVRVTGTLDLDPPTTVVPAAFVVRDSCIAGGVRAAFIEFRSIVDLSDTTVTGRTDFYSSQLDRAGAFDGTTFSGHARFAVADLRWAPSFYQATFADGVSFADTSFDRGADFSGAQFHRDAIFDNADLSQQSRFTLAEFFSMASFTGTRFGGGSDFSAAQFHHSVDFDLSTADGDLGFQQAHFYGRDPDVVSFNSVLYHQAADFSDAGPIAGTAIFDQAVIAKLDLGGAQPDWFGTPSRIDELRIDPTALAAIKFSGSRTTKENDLRRFESAALNADDLAAANEARVLRYGLQRSAEMPVVRQLDWAFAWGIAGYFVRPWHPALALLALFVLGVGVRCLANCKSRRTCRAFLVGLAVDGRGALRALRKIKPDGATGAFQLEVLLYTALIAVLLVNLEHVSPTIRNLVEGLL
jgi:uncharacterized protein YjbI with pentapeptide repeats